MENSLLKAVTVRFFNISIGEDDYFVKLRNIFETLLENGSNPESFESGGFKYLWKLESKAELSNTPCYLFSLIKEIKGWPLIFTDTEAIEISPPKGVLGNITFGLVCPAYKFLLCFSEAGGAASFKRFLSEFSLSGLVRLDPLLDSEAEERVYAWDIYKRFSLKMDIPSVEDVAAFEAGKFGGRVNLLGYLEGSKLDLSVDAGSGKQRLSNITVQESLPLLSADDSCKSLTLRGFDFEGGESETIDLKNPQLKYKDKVEIRGNYTAASDALQILKKAAAERSNELFKDK
ncbi:MAG: hypothetical protein LBP51_08255 [Deferribacteraceae bacterium]|jgi:hypothetical protein|nr:hypothetical protein [Deferribacteraceae bacterium]